MCRRRLNRQALPMIFTANTRCCWGVFLVALLLIRSAAGGEAGQPRVDFSREVRPLLSTNCFPCHGPDAKARKADLRLDTKAGAFANRDGTRVLVPGDLQKSELFRRITAKDADEHMPPADSKLRLTAKQIGLIRRWIEQGAKWEAHWAFLAVNRPTVPRVRNRKRRRNAIDAFIVSRLEKEGLSPSTSARKETLIRRVTLDLTGLPPTVAEVDAFLRDKSPNAYEKLVDRLLNSPAYGERMAWPWLDAARYADSNGFQGDPERTMWPWRDWLVKALNANKPFDRFTIEMLAGDLLPNATLDQKIATGFNRNHMINGEGGRIPEETRIENVFDRTETTATVWMGLTMTCCRCHDHKYDPVTQREYYRLFAFFNNTSEDGRMRNPRGALPPTVNFLTAGRQRQLAAIQRRVDALARQIVKRERAGKISAPKRPPQQRKVKSLKTLADRLRKSKPNYAKLLDRLRAAKQQQDGLRKTAVRVMVMDDLKKPRATFMLTRGTYNKPTTKVAAGTPAFLPPLPKGRPGNRLALARWLVDSAHPLTARVTVNRYWQQFFGRGLVATTEDFGSQGEKPSHPQLLDWLAAEFVHSGWNVKHIHRLIVTSATYRQSSRISDSRHQLSPQSAIRNPQSKDPGNRLLARFPRYRMPSWMLRDQALAIAGLRTGRLGGPPVNPYQPPGVWAEATFGKKRYRQDHGAKLYRRSLYVFWRRIVGPTMFFDSSARQACTVKPSRTNTPLHALTTLNDTTYIEAARVFAQRVMRDRKAQADRIDFAFRLATARKPTAAERAILTRRLQLLRRGFKARPKNAERLLKVGEFPRDKSLDPVNHAAYTALCTLILNLDEVLSKE
ncbi:MAG: DUF1553 domain-containing protein [Planctomycetaceae bacterium]